MPRQSHKSPNFFPYRAILDGFLVALGPIFMTLDALEMGVTFDEFPVVVSGTPRSWEPC